MQAGEILSRANPIILDNDYLGRDLHEIKNGKPKLRSKRELFSPVHTIVPADYYSADLGLLQKLQVDFLGHCLSQSRDLELHHH